MNALLKREPKPVERLELFDWFDRMFDDWAKMLPIRRPSFLGREFGAEEMIHVDQFRQNGTLVVRAELPGIDPDKDVEVTVSEGMLHISAERREEEKTEEKAYVRHELHYGSFSRVLPIPEGVTEAEIEATYKDGILEIRVPAPTPEPAKKIPVSKS